jgi:hypothetical protein
MKYIRAQNGMVLSVSQLIPPAKGSRHDPLQGVEVEIWRLNVVTIDGQRHTYAVYTDMEHAINVFSNVMIPFTYSERRVAVLFALGENGDAYIDGAQTQTWDGNTKDVLPEGCHVAP